MTVREDAGGEATSLAAGTSSDDVRDAAWFHELDAWTEYWDIYHPETRGRFYFGDGKTEPGLLSLFLPRERRPPVFTAWTRMALEFGSIYDFIKEVRSREVSAALIEVDDLVGRLFTKHFGDPADRRVQADYLEAIFRFATGSLPPATERYARIPDDDPRKSTALHHAIEGDIMWFAWALELEGAYVIAAKDQEHARRALLLAGVAVGCPAHFAWHGHRRTRSEYGPNATTKTSLLKRGMQWATEFDAAAAELHTLFRICEWGED